MKENKVYFFVKMMYSVLKFISKSHKKTIYLEIHKQKSSSIFLCNYSP